MSRIPIDATDWVRDLERRSRHEARRPAPRSAVELLGPGFGPRAIEVADWNSDTASYNGYFWSKPTAVNGPSAAYWMGQTISNADQQGFQQVTQFMGGASPPARRIRTFAPNVGGRRVYSAWVAM